MSPAQILIKEHTLIGEGLNLFEAGINKFEAGQEINKTFFIDLIMFFRGYVDQTHRGKEEKIFLPAAKKLSDQNFRACAEKFTQEHMHGRNFITALEQSVNQYYGGDPSAKINIIANAKDYIQLLRSHIDEENQCFPNIESAFSPDQQSKIAEGFDKIEVEEIGEGVHDKYLEILENAKIVLRI